ncbi:MAG: hypothetical protein ISN26_01465 [Betaproteobacteria bacterium AqS2]|uniref:DUF4124 domain-containing protein n=1 Tax=Candidatus Amphirhobacter heronislandensis TaxID=1732024 RepID=A0A930Y0X4_9GAMM|nr:hypothetical protein [Betaproteobacteria bacterium AqS2]
MPYFISSRTATAALALALLAALLPAAAPAQWYICKRDDSPIEIKTNRLMQGHACREVDSAGNPVRSSSQPQQQQQQSSANGSGKQDSGPAQARADSVRARILIREHNRELLAFQEARDKRARLTRQEDAELYEYYSLKMESHGINVRAIKEELARLQ